MNNNQNIVIYQNEEGNVNVEVKLVDENLWLSLNQIAELFDRDKSVISRHLKNIFQEEELDKDSVVAFFATTAQDGKTYQVEYFNLDAIISVGYRVNSKRGTQFRQWSSKVLKEYLQKGYTINHSILDSLKIKELQQSLELISHTLSQQELVNCIGHQILDIINKYHKTWDTLLRFDENRLSQESLTQDEFVEFELRKTINAINQLKKDLMNKGEASSLFGNQRNDQLDGILASLNQTFDNEPLYKTHVERAAHLLYFIIKDHPFSDGNKRIGCFLFLIYLHKANLTVPENNHLIAMALLIAESNPAHKDLIIQLIMRLIG